MATNLSDQSIFNPSYKELPIPSYLGLSKPISDPRPYADTSKADSIRSVAQYAGIFPEVVKVAHKLTEQTIDDRIHAEVDAIREPYKQDLGNALKSVQVAAVDKAAGKPVSSDAASLLSTPNAENALPPELAELTGNLNVLGAAKGAGKISRTRYIGEIDTLASDMRARFPGWREYIDAKFAKETGVGPMSLINARIADINSLISANKAGKDKLLEVAYRKENFEHPEMPKWLTSYENGQVSKESFMKFLNDINRNNYKENQAKTRLATTKATTEDNKIVAEQAGSEIAHQVVTDSMAFVHARMGVSNDPKVALTEIAEKAKNPETALQFKIIMQEEITRVKNAIRNKLAIPNEFDPNKKSLLFHIGDPTALTEAAIKPLEAYSKFLGKDEIGMATYVKTLNDVRGDVATMNLVKAIPELQDIEAFQKKAGSLAPTLLPDTLKGDVNTKWQVILSAEKMRTFNRTPDPITGVVSTLKDKIKEYNRGVLADPDVHFSSKDKYRAEVTNQFIKQIENLKNPNDPFHAEYVETAFSPEGKGLIAEMDPRMRATTINRLLDKKITDNVFKLGGAHWNMYSDWTKSAVSAEFLADALPAVDRIVKNNSFEWTYDDKTYKFGIKPTAEPSKGPVSGPRYPSVTVQSIVEQELNKVISNYTYILSKEGKDINAELFNIIQQVGGNSRKALTDAMRATIKKDEKK